MIVAACTNSSRANLFKKTIITASLDAPSFPIRDEVDYGWSLTEESNWEMASLPISSRLTCNSIISFTNY